MRALHRVLLDQQVREKYKQRSYEQVKKFSWEASARQILDVYKQVAGKQVREIQYDKAV
jgi:glycosyltransferase involved in cell wall biosynthesis